MTVGSRGRRTVIEFDPLDPQADQVYRAQSIVIKAHIQDNLRSLAEIRAFVNAITSAEGVKVTGVYRLWMHTGPSRSLVDRGAVDRDLTGQTTKDPSDRSIDVTILPWTQRYSHYERDFMRLSATYAAHMSRELHDAFDQWNVRYTT